MGKRKFDFWTLSFKEEPDVKFSSIPDNVPITTVDAFIAKLFNGNGVVSRADAMGLPAVYRGRNLICNIATLPLKTYYGRYQEVTNELLEQIDPRVANIVTIEMTVEDLIFDGVAYWMIDEWSPYNGYPSKAHRLNPDSVIVNDPVGASPTNLSSGVHPDGEYWVDGKRVDSNRIIRFDSPHAPLLKTMAPIIRRAIATAKASETYAANPMPKMVFTPKAANGVAVDPADAATMREHINGFAEAIKDSPYGYVGAALDAKPLDWMSPADLQLVEIEKNIERGLANALGIDPSALGIPSDDDTYNNAQDKRQDRINDLLNVFMQAIEQRLNRDDVTPPGYFVKFFQDDYMRADQKTRMEVYTGYIAAGVMTPDEVRDREGLPPMTPEQRAQVIPASIRPPANQPQAITAAQRPELTFDDDTDLNLAFEGAQFARESVNTNSRTVVGLAVPYGQSARSGGKKWEFEKGSLKYTDLKRVKLLRDHDNSQAVGYAIDAEDTDKGLVVTFKVAPGPAGDKALADFLAGTHDGLSIGVNFEESDFYVSADKPGVHIVRNAQLREVSQTAMPAFDDSRSIRVTAHREVENMSENTPGAVTETAPEKTYTLAEFQAMQATFNKPAPEAKPASVQADTNVAPRIEKPNTQEKKVEFVSEPPLYRFDGTGEHEFSADVISMNRGDGNARKRVLDYMKAEFAVSTANSATLNPTIQKPGMYVDQLDYTTPIWNTINKGAPDNGVNPFAFPKFSSSSGLVADHVEGTEPSLGAFAVTNQTVTPTALSGKIEINREAWDQGGTPALSNLIRNEMHRAYREGLETAAATFLDAQSFTTITLATAAADSTLEAALVTALVDLQGQRGGYRLTDFLVHADLYKALVLAKDTTGRRLFPALGAMNATGTVGRNFSSVDINGLIGRYAWALGASGIVAEKSYLLNPADVHGWATAPQDLTFDIQVKSVYLAVWGYKAFAVSRTEGVRTFSYDPSVS